MQTATLYERKGTVYLHSSSQTTVGVWVANAPWLSVPEDDAVAIGQAILECLAASKQGVPHPTDFKGLVDPLLRLAGVKSFNTFAKSAKCVFVESKEEGRALLHPTRNGGAKEGFVYLPGTMEVSLDPLDGLRAAAIAAFAISELD